MSSNNITFILHKPQLSENIGACARAIKNFNFDKLVLVDPKPSFPNDKVIGLVVQTQCNYFDQLGFPNRVACGLKVEKIGKTSVTYDVGLFNEDQFYCAAQVSFIHVYVDSLKRTPVLVPYNLIKALATISKS